MPATIVHSYFAKDVYDILPKNIKESISPTRIKMFGQSADSLMFYNLFSLLPGKKVRNFSRTFHRNKSQDFFINLITYIKDNNLGTDSDVCSFLVGFICHYELDSTIHPYVFYKTGVFIKGRPDTYKYNGLHQEMEYYLDSYMIFQNEKVEAKDFKMYKYLLNNIESPGCLVEVGFMSNSKELLLLKTSEYQEKICYGIVLGILDYINNI